MFVIAGVTGNTGSVVADALLAAGKKVRVLVRDAAKGQPWKAKGADVFVLATLSDTDGLTKALEGAEGAYLLTPPDGGEGDFMAERRRGIDAVATAVDRSGLPHVVYLSSIGGQHEGGTGPIVTLHYAEERLAKTKAKLTAIRAAYFLENWRAVAGATQAGKLPSFLPPDLVMPTVATRDIGATAAKALLEGASSKVEIIELAGSRDLSARDVAALFGAALGKSVELDTAPLAAVVPAFTSFGMTSGQAEVYREMYEGIANGKVAWEGERGANIRSVRGVVDPATVIATFVA